MSSLSSEKRLLDKVLIANRGEIACRVIKTCKRLGVKTVSVFSDADRNSKHVEMADEAFHIGPSTSSESYLRADKILDVAKKSGSKAIHPGYGFLSENADFSRACRSSGIKFIGPPPEAIESMGSKSNSKAIMMAAKVPVTPGYFGSEQDPAFLLQQAKTTVGFPVMIKAVSGGGGKGMRLVWTEDEFLSSLESAKREAMKSFKSSNVLVEKFIQSPRHIEFQIFADGVGGCIYLNERDCSVQRRHQKVLEEAPAPGMTAELRHVMGQAAVNAALAVGYEGAGTVEFLVDSKKMMKGDLNCFYFCEMNTRLQVEHPVTEMITGLDLVELQLSIAAGNALPLKQNQVTINGHAIEARVYAENPQSGFLPSTGTLNYLDMPEHLSKDVRVDSGVRQGDEVSMFYDPMIAKLITWGKNRQDAVHSLALALTQFKVDGVSNNIKFLVKTCLHPEFLAGGVTTGFLDDHGVGIISSTKQPINSTMQAIAATLIQRTSSSSGHGCDWRLVGGKIKMMSLLSLDYDDVDRLAIHCDHAGTSYHVKSSSSSSVHVSDIVLTGDDMFSCHVDGHVIHGRYSLSVNGKRSASLIHASVRDAVKIHLWVQSGDCQSFVYSVPIRETSIRAMSSSSSSSSKQARIVSPMPGKLIKLFLSPSSSVKAGQPVAIIEAMKMEHVVKSARDGKIKDVMISEGSVIEEGGVIMTFE